MAYSIEKVLRSFHSRLLCLLISAFEISRNENLVSHPFSAIVCCKNPLGQLLLEVVVLYSVIHTHSVDIYGTLP